MTTKNSPPSRNPADEDNLTGILKLALKKFLQNTDDMLPAQVIAYDRGKNRAKIQAVISVVTTDAQIVSRAQIASVPVFQYGGGGFVSSFPLFSGDTGWIKANDRDISGWKQSLRQSTPNTQRKHSFKDAMFFPDTLLNGITIAGEDVDHAVWQNFPGSVKIALWQNLIKIIAPNVGIGGTPAIGLQLDVQSTAKAFAPPRMTTAQRNAIPSPQEGFMIYNLSTHALEVYTNAGWP